MNTRVHLSPWALGAILILLSSGIAARTAGAGPATLVNGAGATLPYPL